MKASTWIMLTLILMHYHTHYAYSLYTRSPTTKSKQKKKRANYLVRKRAGLIIRYGIWPSKFVSKDPNLQFPINFHAFKNPNLRVISLFRLDKKLRAFHVNKEKPKCWRIHSTVNTQVWLLIIIQVLVQMLYNLKFQILKLTHEQKMAKSETLAPWYSYFEKTS